MARPRISKPSSLTRVRSKQNPAPIRTDMDAFGQSRACGIAVSTARRTQASHADLRSIAHFSNHLVHEGLDIFLYRTFVGQAQSFDRDERIAYRGREIGIDLTVK